MITILILQVLAIIAIIFVAVLLSAWWQRRLAARARTRSAGTHCPCGYALSGLELARCPECGRVIGFDATPEQLGLKDEHLRRIQAARAERAAAEEAAKKQTHPPES